MPKPITVKLNEERDFPLLTFLWKWKVLTTSALTKKFFAQSSPITAHKRLWQLERAGFICSKSFGDGGRSFVWALDRKGFCAIREALPVLREEGFKTEFLGHDLLVSAFHLGDFLCTTPKEVKLFSEQQLRRYDFEFYPSVIPKTELHRSDGYTIIENGKGQKVIAIEVEMTPKKKSDYDAVAEFYQRHKADSILWLVPRQSLAARIHGIISQCVFEQDNHHSFVLLSDFSLHGWNARINCGAHRDKTVIEIFGNKAETNSNQVSSRFLLDVRKAPHRSKIYRNFLPTKILD